jgi:hypothetical protein
MVNKRLSSTRRRRSFTPRFRLQVFEAKLRAALRVESNRPCGVPGGEDRLPDLESRSFVKQYLVDNLLSKYDDGKGSESKVDQAFQKFWKAEEGCYWRNWFFSQDTAIIDKRCPALVKARDFIYKVMGPEVDLNRVARGFGWGPGASTRLPKVRGDACYKYSGKPEVTPNAYQFGVAAICHNPNWKQLVDIVDGPATVWGNRLTTVPKNYKIDRMIAVEPCLNMYLQKGLGEILRQKLLALGIDLRTQMKNQTGAKDFSLATIDFSMASDSVSQGLVSYLFPKNWVDLIQDLRSEIGVLPDGTLHRYSKVSSMGNGFTFELESLIFLALARAVTPSSEHHRVLVYGDDVIIPVEYVEQFISASLTAGFTINSDKSHWDGLFRESCGIHVHDGNDVTPFFIRRPVKTLSDLFLLHNQLYRWCRRVDHLLTFCEWEGIQKILRDLRLLAPAKWRRPRLPDGYGDGAFIGSFQSCDPMVHPDGWEYFKIIVLENQGNVKEVQLPGLLVKSLTNLHKRKWVTPTITESVVTAEPMSNGPRRLQSIAVPWDAWG